MRRNRVGDERGVTLLLFALCAVLLLTLVAFAVDLGQGRFASRDNQQAADLAALAAGYELAGHGSDPPTSQPRAACEAAFRSASTNLPGFSPSASQIAGTCSGFPADGSTCVSSPPASATPKISRSLTLGEYTLTVEWPVSLSELSDSRFFGNGLLDGTDNCDRMRIDVDRTQDTAFAGVIGVDSLDSNGGAVVLGAPAATAEGVAALLLLEREGCGALQRSGQGKVVVKTVQDPDTSKWQPGVVQTDSAGSSFAYGSGLECKVNSPSDPTPKANASGYTVYASCSGSNLPGIVAESTPDGTRTGVIATHAEYLGSLHAASCYSSTGSTGLNVQPVDAKLPTSRKPADNRFNPSTRPSIDDLHEDAYLAAVTNAATTPGAVYTDCNVNNDREYLDSGVLTFACGTGGFKISNNKTVSIPNASAVKFIGGVDVGGGANLNVPVAGTVTIARGGATDPAPLTVAGSANFANVRSMYIGGEPVGCAPNSACTGRAVNITGSLRVNTGTVSANTCGSETSWAEVATLGGAFNSSGSIVMCQTMVYVGTATATHGEPWRASGGINCTGTLPCPLISTTNSSDRLTVSGGAGSNIVWTAPNQTNGAPSVTDPFEGLALWVEGTGTSEIKGSGTLLTTGVFFLPNALFGFNGQANSANPFNAQFFARTLNFSGLGDLNLSPDPRDSVPTPIPGTFALIR